MRKATVKIGTKFYYCYADGKPEWTVIEKRGRGAWIAKVVDGDDWVGTHKCFSTEEIQSAIGMSNFWKKSGDESKNFYWSLATDQIVHYSSGFGQYVRGRVTNNKDLMPIALVGKWHGFDLPHRYSNGDICLGYHAEQIKNGKTFQPHASNIWEYSEDLQKKEVDPRKLAPIDLTVPPMTVDEQNYAELVKQLESIRNIAANWSDRGPAMSLKIIRDMVTA